MHVLNIGMLPPAPLCSPVERGSDVTMTTWYYDVTIPGTTTIRYNLCMYRILEILQTRNYYVKVVRQQIKSSLGLPGTYDTVSNAGVPPYLWCSSFSYSFNWKKEEEGISRNVVARGMVHYYIGSSSTVSSPPYILLQGNPLLFFQSRERRRSNVDEQIDQGGYHLANMKQPQSALWLGQPWLKYCHKAKLY